VIGFITESVCGADAFFLEGSTHRISTMLARPPERETFRTIRTPCRAQPLLSSFEDGVAGPRRPTVYFPESDGIVKAECVPENSA
jgi:hypothetical protein